MNVDFSKLAAPFPPDRISWRVGATNREKTKGMALAYIDSRDVQDRLDQVCGPAGWQCRYPHAGAKTVCEIGIKVGDEWIWKADGAGDSDVEAEKGALSDAFKRSAVKWGIGRYLYDCASPWIEIEAYGKSYKIKDSEYAKLRRSLGERAAPAAPAVAPVNVDSHANDVLTLMAQIDHHDAPGELTKFGTSIAADVSKMVKADQDKVRGHFASRMKALKQAELVGAG